jgi:hypothetical protein
MRGRRRSAVYNDDPRPQPAFKPEQQANDLPLFSGTPITTGQRFESFIVRLQGSQDPTERVLALLLDGAKHTVAELREVGGASGDRRARDLRASGLTIGKMRNPADLNGPCLYWLVNPSREALNFAIEDIARRRTERFRQRKSA